MNRLDCWKPFATFCLCLLALLAGPAPASAQGAEGDDTAAPPAVLALEPVAFGAPVELRLAEPRDEASIELSGRIGGRLGAMRLDEDGRHAYLVMGTGVVVLDISGEEAEIVARFDFEALYINDLALHGDRLFVSVWPWNCCMRDHYAQLHVLDVSDPRQPRRLAFATEDREISFVSGARFPLPLALDPVAGRLYFGGSAYALDEGEPLRFLGHGQDVERPYSDPTIVSPRPIAWAGYLYQGHGHPAYRWQLQVRDLRDPQAPAYVGAIELGTPLRQLARVGSHLVAATDLGLQVFDLSEPGQPRLVSRVEHFGEPRALVARGARVGLLTQASQLLVYDLTEPAAPRLVRQLSTRSEIGDLALTERDLFAIAPSHGIHRLVDFEATALHTIEGLPRFLKTMTNPRRMARIGEMALVVLDPFRVDIPVPVDQRRSWSLEQRYAPELALVDLSQPARPLVVDRIESRGLADIGTLGTTAYMALGDGGLAVAELEGSELRGRMTLPEPAGAIAVDAEAGRLYTGALTSAGLHLAAYDLADPSAPSLLARHHTGALHEHLRLSTAEGRLYVATDRGLSIHALEGERLPQVAHRDLGGDPFRLGVGGVAARGRQVWVAAGDRLHSLHRSETLGLAPLAATEPIRSTIWNFAQTTDLLLLGEGLALVGEGGGPAAAGRLHAIDVRDRWDPRHLGAFGGAPGYVQDLELAGDQLWLVDAVAGLASIPVDDLRQLAP